MRYLGGKHRIAGWVLENCIPHMEGYLYFLEPFCGGLSVTVELNTYLRGTLGERTYEYIAADGQPALIHLLRALQGGWEPPDSFSEGMYHAAKNLPPSDPLHGFAAYCCSFSGKFWGGYARKPEGRNFAQQGKNALLRKMAALPDVYFVCADFREWDVTDTFIYCDPPYANRTHGYGMGKWCRIEFWKWARKMAEKGRRNMLIVSEYAAPEDITWLESRASRMDIHTALKNQGTIENLYILGGRQ